MRDANIERLLGGYATNTLTEAERSALLEAALDDQDLFDALQDEEVLRDLLQDADSRSAIERALKQPAPQPRKGWFTPAWAWSLGAGAVAAGALTFVMLPPSPSHDLQIQVAVSKPQSTIVSREAEIPSQSAPPDVSKAAPPVRETAGPLVRRKAATSQIPASAPPAPAEQPVTQVAQQPVPQVRQSSENDSLSAGQVVNLTRAQASLPASAGYVAATTLRVDSIAYSVLKRAADGSFARLTAGEDIKAGDSVQLKLRPPISGSLLLQEETPGGTWSTVFPAGRVGLAVTANRDVVIPDSPILVDRSRQLRLVLSPIQLPAAISLGKTAISAGHLDKSRLETERRAIDSPNLQRAIVTNLRLGPGTSSPAK